MGLERAFLCRPESGLPYFDPFITFLCFEIEEIRDHFSQPTWGGPKSKSGLRFAEISKFGKWAPLF